jgi:hypothetical protein
VLLVNLLANENLCDLDVGVTGRPENRYQYALGILIRTLRKALNFSDGGHSVFAFNGACYQYDWAAQARVVGLEPLTVAATPQCACHAWVAPRYDRIDASLQASRCAIDNSHLNRIAVHRATYPISGDVNVWAACSHDKAKSTCVHAKESGKGLLLWLAAHFDGEAQARPSLNRSLQAQLVHQTKQTTILCFFDANR